MYKKKVQWQQYKVEKLIRIPIETSLNNYTTMKVYETDLIQYRSSLKRISIVQTDLCSMLN